MEINKILWIKGTLRRGRDVLKVLTENGGLEVDEYNFSDEEYLYYIDYLGQIERIEVDCTISKTIQKFGKELILPEPINHPLTYKDLDEIEGLEVLSIGLNKIKTKTKDTNGITEIGLNVFATKNQALSVIAAAKISMIRKYCEESYGEIPSARCESYYEIRLKYQGYYDTTLVPVVCKGSGIGRGLLRFYKEEQAKLFLEYNRSLVDNYLIEW